MRRMYPFALLFGCMILAGGCASAGARTDPQRILLISIDGLRADYLVEADRYGLKIPTLRGLMSGGVTARRMIGVFPTVTYPSHVTILTGNTPARHGILSNEEFKPMAEGKLDWYYSAKLIRCPTLTDVFADAGRSTAAVGWPVTVDARIDNNVPEKWDAADFNGTFIARSREASTPGLVDAAEKRFGFTFDIKKLDEHRNLIAQHIVLTHPPDLLLIHYDDLDKKQHSLGPCVPEVFAVLEKIDALIGELLETYQDVAVPARRDGRRRRPQGDGAATSQSAIRNPKSAITPLPAGLIVCVVSDHGFERVDRDFRPNVVLREAGLIDYDAKSKKVRGWRAKAWLAGAAAAIMLADPKDTASRDRARAALANYTGKPDSPIVKIVEPDEIRRLGSNPDAAFMIDAGPGFTFSRSITGEAIGKAIVHGMHGQMPDRPEMAAAFVIAGPGIPHGKMLERVRMIDVAPTLARLAGLSLPGAEGEPIQDALPTTQLNSR